MTGHVASGRACCDTPQHARTWMNRWVISSSARAGSTNARRGLPVAWGDTDNAAMLFGGRVCAL
jgi:hypothetical protein